MHTIDQKPVELFNTLIGLNTGRIEGCQFASDTADVDVLKDLFSRLSETSMICREELVKEVQKLGGKPFDMAVAPQECFRAWLEVITAVSKRDHKAVLHSCIYEKNVVLRSYLEILNDDEDINSQQQRILERHYQLLKEDELKVKNLLRVLERAA
jgi:uncharacterized protein (TIGR02284 family)